MKRYINILLKYITYAILSFSISFVIILGIYPSIFLKKEVNEINDFSNVHLWGYQVNDNFFTVTKVDPGMEWENHLTIPASLVTVHFRAVNNECKNSNMAVQLFFNDGINGYTEKNSVMKHANKDELTLQFYINADSIKNFRLDIGTKKKENFQLEAIQVEGQIFSINIYGCLLLGSISLFVFLLLTFLLKKIEKGGISQKWGAHHIFIIAFLGGEILFWIIAAIYHGTMLNTYFLNDPHDTSMDFFNMLSYLNSNSPYDLSANYPPMCFFLLKIIYHFIPIPIRTGNGFYYRELMHAQILYIVCILFLILLTWELIKHFHNGTPVEKLLLSIGIIFSGPMLFTLERGNLIFVSFVFLLIYICFYNSDTKWIRYCSYLALALSASIKLYPALFGILILQKKRYKEVLIAVILGIFGFITPCLLFNGFDAISGMLHGIMLSSEKQSNIGLNYNFSFTNLIKIISAFTGIEFQQIDIANLIIPAVICCLINILSKEEWKKIYSISLFCIWFPSFSYTYTLLLLIPPLLYFLNDMHTESSSWQYLNAFCFFIILIPLSLPTMEYMDRGVKFPLSMPTLVINLSILILTCSILMEGFITINQAHDRRKNETNL